ncbi:hypothetical protein HNY73_017189 [Argiope bruennichi]|uniref:Uncharacterized protein n=1 Tax=Argiope bruennichi TaxID=94029 RepID=A0A8T0EMA5_ARGBR|nr:hypothetical protein HNY73_017189 [Argiope bruennichi]
MCTQKFHRNGHFWHSNGSWWIKQGDEKLDKESEPARRSPFTLLDIDAKRADTISRLEEVQGNLSLFVCQDAKCNIALNTPPFLKAQVNEQFQSPTKHKTARNNPSQNSNQETTTKNRFLMIENIKECETEATPTEVPPIKLRYANKDQTKLADIQKVCSPTENDVFLALSTEEEHKKASMFESGLRIYAAKIVIGTEQVEYFWYLIFSKSSPLPENIPQYVYHP